MQDGQLTRISHFIWSLADDVLRDIYARGKYRDVILPMTVLRRLDAVLEPTKAAVLERKKLLDAGSITEQEGPLQDAAGQAFYNTSPFTLRSLRARAAASAPAPQSSSCAPTSPPTWRVSPPMSRTYWTTFSSTIRLPVWMRMRSAL